MNTALRILFVLLVSLARPCDADESTPFVAPPSKLFWRNNEYLTGSLLSSDGPILTWKSDVVTSPVVLDRSRLLLVNNDVPKETPVTTSEWSVILRNGDSVLGNSLKLSATTAALECPRHGPLSLKLSDIRSIRRLHGAGLVFSGPTGTAGWHGPGYLAEGGSQFCRRWNGTMEYYLDLPDKVEVAFKLRSVKRLDFHFIMAANGLDSPRITTWQNELVLLPPNNCKVLPLAGSQAWPAFVPLKTLKDSDTQIALRMFWDKTARRAWVSDEQGKLLGEIGWKDRVVEEPTVSLVELGKLVVAKPPKNKAPKPRDPPKPGVYFRNQGVGLVLDDVLVRRWDGAVPKPRALVGKLPFVESSTNLSAANLEGLASLDLSHVQSIRLSEAALPLQPSVPPSSVLYANGTVLTGRLLSYTEDHLTIKTPWSDKPVSATLEGLSRMVFDAPEKPAPEPAVGKMAKLHNNPTTIHGNIVCDGSSQPKWKFVGGRDALEIAQPAKPQDLDMTFEEAPSPEINPQSTLFITASGEAMRGRFHSIDATGVSLSSDWIEPRTLEHSQVKALRFGSATVQPKGFRDPAWKIIMGSEKMVTVTKGATPEKDSVKLEPSGVYGHSTMSRGHDIHFTLGATDGYGGLQVTVYGETDHTPSNTGLAITLYYSGNQFYVLTGDGNRGVRSEQMLRTVKGPVNIKLTFANNKVQVFANDTKLLDQVAPLPAKRGRALLFTPGTMWGNSPRPMEVSNFGISTKATDLEPLSVADEVKQTALMIPRFRREMLPSQALIAENGDVVRGTVDAATDKLIHFSSGLDTMNLPLERVQSIVWLTKPTPAPATPGESIKKAEVVSPPVAKSATHWVYLNDQSRLALKVEAFTSDKIMGHSELFGKVSLPLSSVNTVRWAAEAPTNAMRSFTEWQLAYAPEPVLPETGGSASPLLGKAAPDFTVRMLDGSDFKLSDHKGEVVVLDFWATWCGPCMASMPGLLKVIEEHKGKKVRIIGIDQGEPAATVKRLLDQRHWALPVGLDENNNVGALYLVEGIPHTVLIGPDGKVAWTNTGASADGEEKLTAAIAKALGN